MNGTLFLTVEYTELTMTSLGKMAGSRKSGLLHEAKTSHELRTSTAWAGDAFTVLKQFWDWEAEDWDPSEVAGAAI